MNLEGGVWWYAHLVGLPGCFTRGASRGEALAALPGAVGARLAWLGARGIGCTERSGLEVVEEQAGIPELGESGGAVALFRSDLEPVDGAVLGEALGLMALSRGELLGVVGGLTEGELDAEPVPGKRTVRRDVGHIVNAEEWYVSRLGRRYQGVYEGGLREAKGRRRLSAVERLMVTRPPMIAALEAALGDGRQWPFTRRAYTKYPGEQWTLRKVLRRFLEHEREHLGTINRTLGALG
ncbi:MAG: DinB family protein [Candidatus Bathyarchaeota archaeon]|nr:DinB family protein [Candidatus Bathyarchaeota archaeon]